MLKYEAKTLTNIFHVIVNTNSIVQHVVQIKNGIMINASVIVKFLTCKKDYSWNPSTCICENSRYLKSTGDDSVSVCDEIINISNSVSTALKNTIPTNVTNTVSIKSDIKKVALEKSNCLTYTISLVIIMCLLFVVVTFNNCYTIMKDTE